MIVWRLVREEFSDLSGHGAFLYGGRWNYKGSAVVYTASNLSLSCLEILAALPSLKIPKGYVSLKIEIPDHLKTKKVILKQDIKNAEYCRAIGDKWLHEGKHAFVVVPSVIVAPDDNILINPHHPEAQEIRTIDKQPFEFDPRHLY